MLHKTDQYGTTLVNKLPSVQDRGQTDRVATNATEYRIPYNPDLDL